MGKFVTCGGLVPTASIQHHALFKDKSAVSTNCCGGVSAEVQSAASVNAGPFNGIA
jgi:hypothetical protein